MCNPEVWPFSCGPYLLGWVTEGNAFGRPKSQTPVRLQADFW